MTFKPFSHGVLCVRPDGTAAAISLEGWEAVHSEPRTLLTSRELRNLASGLRRAADEMDEAERRAIMDNTGGKVLVRKRARAKK